MKILEGLGDQRIRGITLYTLHKFRTYLFTYLGVAQGTIDWIWIAIWIQEFLMDSLFTIVILIE